MVRYETKRLVCPQCGHKLGRGFRRFGPAQVRCGHCDAVLQTDLPDWHAPIPFRGRMWKAGIVLREILNPSWIGVPGFMGFMINIYAIAPLVTIATGLLGALPVLVAEALVPPGMESPSGVVGAIAMILAAIGAVTSTVGLFGYPLLLILRLIRMVRESKTYARTRQPPLWR